MSVAQAWARAFALETLPDGRTTDTELTFMNKIAIAIHGGAGTILKSNMTAELAKEYQNAP